MNAVNLTVDIHCHRPNWIFAVDTTIYQNTLYRIYIDDDLITERTWIWDNNTIIQENIWIHNTTPSTHTLSIVPLRKNIAEATFTLNNFTVVNQPFTSEQINDLTISFTL